MRTMLAGMVVAALLLIPLGLMGNASAAGTGRDLSTVVLGPISTDRFGGGDLVAVKAGDALFGVRYGTSARPNDIVIFAEYKRFLGGAEIVDGQGDHLATRGIPVYTVLAQSLSHFVEFRHVNATDGFDLLTVERMLPSLTANVPVKAASLTTAWQLSGLTNETVAGTTYVNFTVSATNLTYVHVMDATNPGDGQLNLVAFTFHLKVDVRDKEARVPWFRVTVDDGSRYDIERVQFLGYRNVSGPSIAMGAKYDHRIEGWDFAYPEDRLALLTQLRFGNFFPERTAAFLHEALSKDRADDDLGRPIGDAHTVNLTDRPRPSLFTRDQVYFDDDFTRIGRFQWATNVTVDGRPSTMTFNLQGGGPLTLTHGSAFFVGFWLRGAFVYPAGQVIVHDPVMSADALLDLPIGVNLTPLVILAAQVAVVVVALGTALYLRAKVRRHS